MEFSAVLARKCNNVRGHVAIITETESTYIMVESTLRFDDVEDDQAFSCFSGRFKGHVCGQENGAGDDLGTRLGQNHSTSS